QRAPAQAFAQGLPGEQFHHRERDALVRAHVEDRDEVGVREGRQRLGLPLEAHQGLRRASEAFRQHLDGYVPIQSSIAGAVHLAHPPRPERGEDLVVRQFHACAEPHSSHPWWSRAFIGEWGILPTSALGSAPRKPVIYLWAGFGRKPSKSP